MSELYLFMQLKWKPDPNQPYIWFSRVGEDNFEEFPLTLGKELNFKLGSERLCIGSDHKKGVWRTCISIQKETNFSPLTVFRERMIPEPYIQCQHCVGVEYFTCRISCIGDYCNPTSPIARELCEPPNTHVYLTHVGGEVKVGVSLGVYRRWIEQGSDLALKIAQLPGLEARELEQRLAKELGFKLQVRNSSKIEKIGLINIEDAKHELLEAYHASKPIVNEIVNRVEKGESIRQPDVADLRQYYGNIEGVNGVQKVVVEDGAEIGGTILGVKGSILVLQQDMYYYAIDTKQLQARTFEFLDRKAKVKAEKSLEEWF